MAADTTRPFQFCTFLNPRAQVVASVMLSAALLLWPALWNGYPLVFSDSGTYISQAVRHYVGWDRPVFYSLFLLPLHLTLTTWPVIVAQALLTAHTLHLVRRTLVPGVSTWWLVPLTATLTITTSLPWFVTQLIPDVFTGLLTLTTALLIFVPERLSPRERLWLVAFTAFMIATHQSHVPLALGMLLVLLPLRRKLCGAVPLGVAGIARSAAPLTFAVLALVSVNAAGIRPCVAVAFRQHLPARARDLRRTGPRRVAPRLSGGWLASLCIRRSDAEHHRRFPVAARWAFGTIRRRQGGIGRGECDHRRRIAG